jgi:hypothetical protein
LKGKIKEAQNMHYIEKEEQNRYNRQEGIHS